MESTSSNFHPSRWLMPLVILILAVMGVFYIYSAGYAGPEFPVRTHWLMQIFWCMVGFAAYTGLAHWDYHSRSWQVMVLAGYLFSLVLLLAVIAGGQRIGGAARWIRLGGIMLQPAEFAKVFTLLMFCGILAEPGNRLSRRWRFFLAVSSVLVPWILILIEPSFGNAFLLVPCCSVVVAAKVIPAGVWKCLLFLLLLAILCGTAGLLWLRKQPPEESAKLLLQVSQASGGFFHDYHLQRLQGFLSAQGGWNERQALLAVSGGGLTGKGYLNGTMKGLGYLPRTVAPTDFIFAVIAEEGGFLCGVLPVMLAYAMLLCICLHWGGHSADEQGLFMTMAISTMIFLHILIAVGMAVRLLPIIGLPLPFLSYGGSFAVTSFAILGIAASVARFSEKEMEESSEEKPGSWLLRLGKILKIDIREE